MDEPYNLYRETPLLFSHPLSHIMGTRVYLKIESLQPSGSFKNRGIGHFCAAQAKKGATTFVCSSGGNAGLAAAFAARQLGIPITVVVPETTTQNMLEKIRQEQASVRVHGKDWQEADTYAQRLCNEQGACYVPPFDHPLIWEGNATLIREVAQTGFCPNAVVVAVGGGGLLCGVLQGMHAVGWHAVPVYAVETTGAASFAAALDAGHVVTLDQIDTVAKSLGARAVTKQAVEWTKKHPIYSKLVSDESALEACRHFANDHRVLVEPACGAPLSLCYERRLETHENILVIVCGGADVAPRQPLHVVEAPPSR